MSASATYDAQRVAIGSAHCIPVLVGLDGPANLQEFSTPTYRDRELGRKFAVGEFEVHVGPSLDRAALLTLTVTDTRSDD